MKRTIVSSTDWHLDAITAGLIRYPEIDKAIDESVDCAIDLDAWLYIFNGDLTDPDTLGCHAAIAKAIEAAWRLSREGIASLWLTGNHDVIEDGSGHHTLMALRHVPEAVVADKPGMYFGDIFCLPYTATSHNYDPDEVVRSEEETPKVVVGHLNLEGIVPGNETTHMPRGRDVFWPIEALEECWPDALLLGGHYHERQKHRGVNIVGSLARLAFGEEDNDPAFAVVSI